MSVLSSSASHQPAINSNKQYFLGIILLVAAQGF
jgi:hypothetical protein